MSNNKDKSTEVVNLLRLLISKVDALADNVRVLSAEKGDQTKSEENTEILRQEVFLQLKELGKDLRTIDRRIQIDNLSFARDLILFEERLAKIESKLEIKN